ncbi:aldehyde dehydrogenase family protein [Geomicrobium sp. JCM 19038]|uniref:aldehyde dehydrogenase family protein n=1 Tax=Geomicrobium sp. JCM 19038 TaxID=1460635 RepID=UPI00045F3D51|nr:aldehyde dehydrogenase family protein [Geomicrobium sp. JCM 19038]GAK08033.1 aldehyde dehydrogenase [Geomicrobium sp. JCM 19038]
MQKPMYINGVWQKREEELIVLDPATRDVHYSVPKASVQDVNEAIEAAHQTFHSEAWRSFKPHERGYCLHKVAADLRERLQEFAKAETLDVGKPLKQSEADVEAAARYFEYYAAMADKVLGETIPIEPGILDYTVREPLGVTAHIIPWNYPVQITARSVAAAIAMGNTTVVKPAEQTPSTALLLAESMEKAGIPTGVYHVVTGTGQEAGQALASHPLVRHIAFTGSVKTGSTIMQTAAKQITAVTPELGGKSPQIVFSDCHFEQAVQTVTNAITQNAGQTCSAGSRLIIEASIEERFVEALKANFEKLSIGPGIENYQLGPIITDAQVEQIDGYIERAKADGATIITGGTKQDDYYYLPTIITKIDAGHPIAQEEVFGPVITVHPFKTEEEAIALANGTDYGLVTGIWTNDIGRAHRIAEAAESGQVFINNYGAGGGIQMPFGGYKRSGYGREKGLEALQNYTQLKNVAVSYRQS